MTIIYYLTKICICALGKYIIVIENNSLIPGPWLIVRLRKDLTGASQVKHLKLTFIFFPWCWKYINVSISFMKPFNIRYGAKSKQIIKILTPSKVPKMGQNWELVDLWCSKSSILICKSIEGMSKNVGHYGWPTTKMFRKENIS